MEERNCAIWCIIRTQFSHSEFMHANWYRWYWIWISCWIACYLWHSNIHTHTQMQILSRTLILQTSAHLRTIFAHWNEYWCACICELYLAPQYVFIWFLRNYCPTWNIVRCVQMIANCNLELIKCMSHN